MQSLELYKDRKNNNKHLFNSSVFCVYQFKLKLLFVNRNQSTNHLTVADLSPWRYDSIGHRKLVTRFGVIQ